MHQRKDLGFKKEIGELRSEKKRRDLGKVEDQSQISNIKSQIGASKLKPLTPNSKHHTPQPRPR